MKVSTKKSFFFFATGFFAAILFTYQISINSWDQQVFFYTSDSQENRKPASIRKRFDLSNMEGTQLMNQSQERLLATAKILMNQENVGIELGHFVAKNHLGHKDFACKAFNKITLVFKAGDMLVSGAPPEMTVSGPCNYGKNNSRISALWIPMADILKQKTGNRRLEMIKGSNVAIEFSNMGDEWPRVWGLASVQLSKSNKPGKEIFIDEQRISEITKKPLTFFWAQGFSDPTTDSL